MPTNWDVEAALEEVAAAIDEGAAKLSMDITTRKMVKDLYWEDFSARTAQDWSNDRSTVLDMARKAGSCAETATIVLWVNGIGTESKHLDQETVLLVCVMVSRLYCTVNKGIWCPNVEYTQPKGKKLDKILNTI